MIGPFDFHLSYIFISLKMPKLRLYDHSILTYRIFISVKIVVPVLFEVKGVFRKDWNLCF